MTRKLLVKLCMSASVLALALAAAVPTVARAANTTPTSFTLGIGANQPAYSTAHTNFRNKTNASLVYAKATQLTTGLVVGVAGIDAYSLSYTNRTDNTYAYFRALKQASSI